MWEWGWGDEKEGDLGVGREGSLQTTDFLL